MIWRELVGVVRAWAEREAARLDLAPLESREVYRRLAADLAGLGEEPQDRRLRSWMLLSDGAKARGLEVLAVELPREWGGYEGLWLIRNSLTPPPFRCLQPAQQHHVLGQIAAEVEVYHARDPLWYRPFAVEYQQLAQACRVVQGLAYACVQRAPLLWDHLERPQRRRVLIEIADYAVRKGLGQHRLGEWRTFYELAGAAYRVAGLLRSGPERV